MLALADEWVWDFWHAHDGEQHHLFFLKARKSLGDPDLRHFTQRIGHAVSPDLRTWTDLLDALGPSESGWDGGTTWTGSVVRADDRWWMFYTGTDAANRATFSASAGRGRQTSLLGNGSATARLLKPTLMACSDSWIPRRLAALNQHRCTPGASSRPPKDRCSWPSSTKTSKETS